MDTGLDTLLNSHGLNIEIDLDFFITNFYLLLMYNSLVDYSLVQWWRKKSLMWNGFLRLTHHTLEPGNVSDHFYGLGDWKQQHVTSGLEQM